MGQVLLGSDLISCRRRNRNQQPYAESSFCVREPRRAIVVLAVVSPLREVGRMAWRGVIRRRACAPLLLLIVVVPSRPRSPTAAEPQVSGRRYTGWWGRFFLVEKAGGGIWSSSSSSEEDENTDLPAWVSGDDSTPTVDVCPNKRTADTGRLVSLLNRTTIPNHSSV